MQKKLVASFAAGFAAAVSAGDLKPPDVTPELLFHAPLDGSAVAKFAKGAASPVRAEHLSFAEGRRGQAVRLTRAANSILAYSAPGNLVPARGTASLWFRRERADDGLADGWTHLAVAWDGAGERLFVNGHAADGLDDGILPPLHARAPEGGAQAVQRFVFGMFGVGDGGTARPFEGFVDDVRIYSAPLSREQVRELYRRETVIEIDAVGTWAVAGENAVIEAKATSPAGCDLSALHWCLCDASGAVVTAWKQPVAGHAKHLKFNLQAGAFRLRATDGTWFYGGVPVNVLRRDSPHARDGVWTPAVIHEPPDPRPASGIERFWRDVNRKEFSHPDILRRAPRRSVVRVCELSEGEPCGRPADLADLIDRTAARMKHAGENVLAYPGARLRVPDLLSAWYAKFDCEGLSIFPVLDLRAASGPAVHQAEVRRGIDKMVGALLDQGAPHRSFKGVCLRVAWRGDQAASFCAHAARKIAERRPDLLLWVDGLDLAGESGRAQLTEEVPNLVLWKAAEAGDANARRHFAESLRHGDVLGVTKGGASADAPGEADALVPFVQAFRALPAVVFDDVGAGTPDGVCLRQKTYAGRSWFYVVNTGPRPVRVTLEVPMRTRDLARDERVGGLMGASTLDLALQPYELRAYSAAEGRPRRVK